MRFWLLALVLACGHRDDPPSAATSSSASSSPAPTSALAPSPAPPPPAAQSFAGVRRDITAIAGHATHVAIGDLDGDGKNELVFGDGATLRVVDAADHEIASWPVSDGIQQLSIADLGDHPPSGIPQHHHAAILAGWGMTREHRDGVARISVLHLAGGTLAEELVVAPTTTRQDVAAIVAIPGTPPQLLIAYFASKYDVAASIATRGATGTWTLAPLATIRMATSWARDDVDGDGKPDIVVGRLYGDAQGADGDAFVLRDGARIAIPTTRGVHGLAIGDLDGDGKRELVLGDGWHQNYRATAKGLVTEAKWGDGAFHASLIEDTAGQYAINRIVLADVDGDGHPEIVTQGNASVRVYKRVGDTWRGVTVAGEVRDLAVGHLEGKPGDQLVTVGDRSEVIDLHDVHW